MDNIKKKKHNITNINIVASRAKNTLDNITIMINICFLSWVQIIYFEQLTYYFPLDLVTDW